MGIASGIELGCSYELGSGRTRIGVLTRPRERLGMVMTPSPDPPFPLSSFIGVYLSLYILTFIPSIYKASYSVQ